jgi:methylated-DNA-[protein]-cysteine S-methyltransferase
MDKGAAHRRQVGRRESAAHALGRLDEYGLTDFQKRVLAAIAEIPRGETRTYKQVAEMIGHPNAYRAVGTALRKNPIPITLPCHRVVKSDGDIGNYSGRGGRKTKRRLLEEERKCIR